MCTFVMLRRPGNDWPVLIAANRDEMIKRPWKEPGRHWLDRPEVVAGLDVLAGGSWLGVNDHGVVAGILNRQGSLGPSPGQRSRGELVLEALDHVDAQDAADALSALDPAAYRTFNLIIADNRDAFWLRHADPTGTLPVTVKPLPVGLSMIASGDLDDDTTRIKHYRPLFASLTPPDPETGNWMNWEQLLVDENYDPGDGQRGAMKFDTGTGFATVSSTIVALPSIEHPETKARIRFAGHHPEAVPFHDIKV